MERIIIAPEDKGKLELVKQLLEAMQIGFEVVPKKVSAKSKLLDDIREGYLEAKQMQEGKLEPKSYSSFSELADDL